MQSDLGVQDGQLLLKKKYYSNDLLLFTSVCLVHLSGLHVKLIY